MSSNLIRWGGLAGVAGMMNVLTAGLIPFAPQEVVLDSFTDYLIEALFVLALTGTLVAIAGLYALQRGALRTHSRGGLLNGLRRPRALILGGDGPRFSGTRGFRCWLPFGRPGGARWAGALGGRDFAGAGVAAMVQGTAHRRFPSHDVFDIATGGAGRIVQGAIWASVGYALLSSSGASAQQPSRVS